MNPKVKILVGPSAGKSGWYQGITPRNLHSIALEDGGLSMVNNLDELEFELYSDRIAAEEKVIAHFIDNN